MANELSEENLVFGKTLEWMNEAQTLENHK